jgi:hypothetical protein
MMLLGQKMAPLSMLRITFIVSLAAFLAGCSVRYGPRIPGFQPGYVDQRLGEQVYQVRIGEAWSKDWPDLEKFAMYRAAELTKLSGSRYFLVMNATTSISSYQITSPATATTRGTVNRYGDTAYFNAVTTITPSSTTSIQGGWYTLDFRVLKDAELTGYSHVVDADQVMRDLEYFIASRR